MVWEYATLELATCEVDNPLDVPSKAKVVKRITKLANDIQRMGTNTDRVTTRMVNMKKQQLADFERQLPLIAGCWILRTADMKKTPVLHFNAAKKEYSIVKGCLYMSSSSHQVVQLAANDGWEMTGGLPVSLRTHFDTGDLLGGYNTVPMMRRKISE